MIAVTNGLQKSHIFSLALIHENVFKLQRVICKSGSALPNAVVLFNDVSLLYAFTCLRERKTCSDVF